MTLAQNIKINLEYEKLLQQLSENDLQLPRTSIKGPMMGSGTNGIAALNLNSRFSGIEIDDEYFRTA